MRILISNDDGVFAPGIDLLARAMAEVADIDVIAPDRNRSGASNSLTLTVPICLRRLPNGYISVEGTPTDCVHLGITGLLDTKADMVISGINEGPNLGDDVWYSGTVAAAIEGRFLGLPAIAISLVGSKHYETAVEVARRLVAHVQGDRLPANTILNVNVPDVPYDELKGYEVARLGTRHKAERTVKQLDPRNRPVYWIGPAGAEEDAGPGTDFCAIRSGKVSVTPLQIDLTHYAAFDGLSSWMQGL